MGTVLVILVGLPVSWITRSEKDELTDERFFAPLVRRKEKPVEYNNKEYSLVAQTENGNKNFELSITGQNN